MTTPQKPPLQQVESFSKASSLIFQLVMKHLTAKVAEKLESGSFNLPADGENLRQALAATSYFVSTACGDLAEMLEANPATLKTFDSDVDGEYWDKVFYSIATMIKECIFIPCNCPIEKDEDYFYPPQLSDYIKFIPQQTVSRNIMLNIARDVRGRSELPLVAGKQDDL